MSTTLLQDIQKGSHGSSWTWGAFGGATEAPVLSRFYGKTDGWTLSFDVAFVWFPGSLPSVNRTSAIANPENVSSAVRTRDGHVRGLAVDLTGDIESTDRGELARYLGTDVSALAIDVKGDLAVVHLPPDGLPPSANAPITLTPIELGPSWTDAKKGKVSSMAPFAKLEPDDSPSCQAARKGFRSILATHGWLRLQVDGTASADNDELLLVRFEEGRLCLEAAEVVPTGDDHILPLDQAFVNLAPYVVVRFSGQPSAAQLQFARDGVTRRPASCALESP